MNKILFASVLASCALMLGACGNSTNDNNAPQPGLDGDMQLQRNAHGFGDHQDQCIGNHCGGSDAQFASQNNHFIPGQNYNYGGQQYTEVCCPQGKSPVIFEGQTRCEDTLIHQQSQELITFGVRFEQRRGKTRAQDLYASYDFMQATDRHTTLSQPTGNCHKQVASGCDIYKPYQCQGIRDNYGNLIAAKCQKTQNYSNIGVCVPTQQQRY